MHGRASLLYNAPLLPRNARGVLNEEAVVGHLKRCQGAANRLAEGECLVKPRAVARVETRGVSV